MDFSSAKNKIKTAEEDVEKYWKRLGPGLVTGASDDDPSGIATYSQAGASKGFGFLWLSLFTFPLMAVVQEMCARIGLVTGQGLASNIRRHYSRPILYVCTLLLLFANIFNIGADLGAMAKGIQLIWPNFHFGTLVISLGVVGLLLEIFLSYAVYARYLKYLAIVLLSYVLSAMFVQIDWTVALSSLVMPSFDFSKDGMLLLCAILGTTISPYLFFWQTSQEVEEEILHGRNGLGLTDRAVDGAESANANIAGADIIPTTDQEIKDMRVDVWSGMFISNLVMFFIIAVCGATLYASGITNIQTAADAALALRPFAGDFSYILFAIGIIGTGMLAIPVLAGSSAYAVSESLGWKFGLYRKLKEARAFYGIIILSTLVGVALNFLGIDPMKALIYSAVANGIVAPVILFFVVSLSGREDVMREKKNSQLANMLGWAVVLLMAIVAVLTLRALLS